jgi:phosphatidylglycerol:prolipoprotein diacylglycerol transferase
VQPLIPYFEPFSIPISGDFGIHGFGILVALGFVFGSRVAMNKARRDGLEPELINKLIGWLVFGVFVGGHLGHLLFYYPEQLKEDPMVLFQVWKGLSSFGGFIACTLLGVWFFRSEDAKVRAANKLRKEKGEPLLPRVNVWHYTDAVLYGFTLGWFFGRMGCFSAHDHPGTETNFYLGVYGMCPDAPKTVACHDLGLYEAIWSLAMFGIFWVLDKKPRFPGFFAGVLLVVYGPFRLFLDIFRHPSTDTRYFGFTPAQYGSVLLAVLGVWILVRRRHLAPIRPAA